MLSGNDGNVAPAQAMRANNGKPQLSYLLSFKGGAFLAFRDSAFRFGLELLSEWYQGGTVTGYSSEQVLLGSALDELLSRLLPDWQTDLARVSMFGANKYARGNYLKGRGWSDTCDSLLRHIQLRDSGEITDTDSGLPHDGHIAWNIFFLKHCVLTMSQFDDRLRAPA